MVKKSLAVPLVGWSLGAAQQWLPHAALRPERCTAQQVENIPGRDIPVRMSSLTGTLSKNVLLEKKSQPDPDLKPPKNKWEGGDGVPAWRALVWPSLPGALLLPTDKQLCLHLESNNMSSGRE